MNASSETNPFLEATSRRTPAAGRRVADQRGAGSRSRRRGVVLVAVAVLTSAGCDSGGGSEESRSTSTTTEAESTSTSFGTTIGLEASVELACATPAATQRLTVRTAAGAALSYTTTFKGEGASGLADPNMGIGSAFADDEGVLTAEWTVPADAKPGPWEVHVQAVSAEGRGEGKVPFTVADQGACP